MNQSEPIEPWDVSGQWYGYYTQFHDRHPIQAALAQERTKISGTMTDAQTDIQHSLFDAVAEAGLPPGTDERIDEVIRQMFPEAQRERIWVRNILPERSRLEGTVDGRSVKFTKVYDGQSFAGYQIGEKQFGDVIESHRVEYDGRLSSNGKLIEGKWVIYNSHFPKGYIEGLFVLRRC